MYTHIVICIYIYIIQIIHYIYVYILLLIYTVYMYELIDLYINTLISLYSPMTSRPTHHDERVHRHIGPVRKDAGLSIHQGGHLKS